MKMEKMISKYKENRQEQSSAELQIFFCSAATITPATPGPSLEDPEMGSKDHHQRSAV